MGDWIAVWQRWFRLEYLLKPLTMLLLLAAVATVDVTAPKAWLLAALAFGIVGDIALLLTSSAPGRIDTPFRVGLAAFLAGHVCYLIVFARHGVHGLSMLGGVLVVAGIALLSLPRVLVQVGRRNGFRAMSLIGTYATAAGVMAVLAIGTRSTLTGIGGALFVVSDSVLARDRFVARLRFSEPIVAVTYHLAQFGIVLGLLA